jgi:predicted solute-binding protein
MPVSRPKVCAVSYLNTVPLVWGMLHGGQKDLFELMFRIPAECADMLASGGADIGIVPAFELLRQELQIIPGLGIACQGPVRSILLVTKVPVAEIRTLAADSSSRTSVQLARVILAERYGARPEFHSHAPDLDRMLEAADAALLIGDSALRVDIDRAPGRVYDLGAEWVNMTGLPMVFAVWAGRADVITPAVVEGFQASFRYGREHMDEIVAAEAGPRGFDPAMVRRYLTSQIVHELGEREYEGMRTFLRRAGAGRAASSATSNAQTESMGRTGCPSEQS